MPGNHKKNSLLCPNCNALISRQEKLCPYCKVRNPASWWKNNFLTAGIASQDRVLSIITYSNVFMFIVSIVIDPQRSSFAFNPFAFLSPSNDSLLVLGATGTVSILQLNHWWSLIAANYLHGSLLHILFNMIALRQIGPIVLQEFGSHRMIIIYTLGGLAGFAISFLAGVRFTVGASAAVCALIGAVLYYGKSRGGSYGHNIYMQIRGWVIGIFIFGFMVPGINNWGHGGGVAAGILLALLLGYKERKRENAVHKIISFWCILATVAVLAWASFNGFVYLVY